MRSVGSQELGRASKETFFSRNRSAVGLGASLALVAASIGSLIYVTMHLRKQDDEKQERKDKSPSRPQLQKKNDAALVQEDTFSWKRTDKGVFIYFCDKSFFAKLPSVTVIERVEHTKGQPLRIFGSVNLVFFSKP